MNNPRAPLYLAIIFVLSATAARVEADPEPSFDAGPRRVLDGVAVEETALPNPRFPQIMSELDGAKATTGKKTTVIDIAEQPAIVDNNLRQTFARVPGVLISEQGTPSIFNVNYRGLGDPHESEFVMFMENGLPIVSDWFGYPTLYYTPPTARVARVEVVRGGSGLLYGPQVGPTINFVMREVQADAPHVFRTDNIFGSDGLFSTYNEVQGGNGEFGYIFEYDHREGDGARANADYAVDGAYAGLAWQPDDYGRWALDLYGYESESGEPGRLTLAQYEADRNLTTTPFNRLWVARHTAVLSHERLVGENTELSAKLWHGYQDRFSRRASAFVPPQAPPSNTTFDRQAFHYTGLDARARQDWGDNHTLTWGVVGYTADSPRSQSRSNTLEAEHGDTLRYRQERDTRYAALFAENVFRIGAWNLVPGARVERLELGIDETLRLASLARPAIDAEFSDTVSLFGFGASYDFGNANQFYANISEGYRPFKYDDVGNPTAELAASNDPAPSDAINYEAGFRGAPFTGFYYDVSAFRIELENKIEQRLVNATDIERVNSGDSRHQGVELALEYDFLEALAPARDDGLRAFFSAALLDAEFTASVTPELVGLTPAYAPDHIIKAGLLYRRGEKLKLGLVGTRVDEHYWQDSNAARGSGAALIPAVIPAYEVWDLTAEYKLNAHVGFVGGVNNLFDQQYFARVRTDGIEPAAERNYYAGLTLSF